MPSRQQRQDAWRNEADESSRYPRYSDQDDQGDQGDQGDYGAYPDDAAYGAPAYHDAYDDAYGDAEQAPYADDERGLILQTEQSLVGVSSTVTHHGAPLLSYTRTMSRFYANRRQRLSLGRYACEVCGDRIGMWAWETPSGSHTHDGCYDRLAWTWTNLYAQQQRLASQGQLE